MFVLDGLLYATQKELNGEEVHFYLFWLIMFPNFLTNSDVFYLKSIIFHCHSNQFCANMSVLSGEPALYTFKAKHNTELAFITKENFHK